MREEQDAIFMWQVRDNYSAWNVANALQSIECVDVVSIFMDSSLRTCVYVKYPKSLVDVGVLEEAINAI